MNREFRDDEEQTLSKLAMDIVLQVLDLVTLIFIPSHHFVI